MFTTDPFLARVTRAALFAGVASLALMAAPAAMAQDADEAEAASSAGNNERITVTARRREESLQDVPVAVTAYTGDQLALIGAQDLTALTQTTPNTTLEVSRGTNSTLTAFIRGVGQQDPVAGFEPGVGIYLDDVYLARPQGVVYDLYDVERIEILRGPQGTLYGRNTIGGAVKYVTKRLTDEYRVDLRGSYGSFNQADIVAKVNLPLTDTFRVGGTVARFTRDGFGENLVNGLENYNKDILGARLTAEWTPTNNLFFRLSGDYTDDDSTPRGGHRLTVGKASGAPILDNVFDTRAGIANQDDQEVEQYGVTLLGEWDISERLTVKSITSYREDESFTPIDFDSLPAPDLDVPAIYENEQFSQELQATYTGDRLQFVAGFYYLDANAFNEFDVVLAAFGVTPFTLGDVDTKTWAVFADASYDVTDQIAISLGGRYTSDERTAQVFRQTFVGLNSPSFGNPAAIPLPPSSDFTGNETFTAFTPRVSISYRPNDDLNVYASYSEGFKGGGFDPRGDSATFPDVVDGFDSETVDAYEIGVKSTLFDGRATANTAFFYSDYTDVQIPGSIAIDTDGDGVDDSFAGTVTNAGAATLWGVEFEGQASITDKLTLTGAVGYINAEYDEFFVNGVNVADQRVFQNTPEWTANIGGTYTEDFDLFNHAGAVFLTASGSYKSEINQFEIPNDFIDQPGYWLVDASLVWRAASGDWSVGVYGRNLTDEEYQVAGYNFPTLGAEGTVTAFYGNPRTITGTIELSF